MFNFKFCIFVIFKKIKLGLDITKTENSNIWINNFHPTLKPPISKKSIFYIINYVLTEEEISIYSIILNFLSDRNLKKINMNFLHHNYVTDVLTFPYSKGKNEIDGELLISLDRVLKNSQYFNTSYENEFKRVIIHGCLHLAGYDDISENQIKQIRNKENYYLTI